ncbi:hypothetical protein E4100_07605 [Soehngenia longivitae]|uniref:Uncharacterized protein n=1 Tax=Soehngenia longivitae TaxID=2562294 RepID=A0A4Z0D538_9FIRM|nr:hypothetical protein [Soehngenia longivitae]TFZ39674.1 hypothetical protein E4100_07605 [Soehngenia longivitae]
MKRILSIVLMIVLSISLLVACTSEPATETEEPTTPDTGEGTETTSGTITKLGLGHIVSIAKSKDKGTDANGNPVNPLAQADVMIAAVGFDADGKVVSVYIDSAQTKVAFDENMQLTSDVNAEVPTKRDLGTDYGMGKVSPIGKEWFEQMDALQEWMVGKTVEEIVSMETTKRDDEHPTVPNVPELTSSVTMDVGEYLKIVEEAWNNAIDVTGAEKVGLGVKTSIAKSVSAGTDANGNPVNAQAQVDTIISATALDADGKVAGTIIDTAQVVIPFDADGKVAIDKTVELKTKNELKEDYGMGKVSPIKKEWYEQAQALAEWMKGKTLDEIKAMKLEEGKPAEEDLVSSVTIHVDDYLAVVEEAINNAK